MALPVRSSGCERSSRRPVVIEFEEGRLGLSVVITIVNIDVLEQWWLAQFGVAATRGPHDVVQL